MHLTWRKSLRPPAVALLLLLGVTGCGGKSYPVHGKVTYPDGTPLTEGLVVFEQQQEGGKAIMARGDIQPDGTYRLSTNKPGDGVPPGKYRVMVVPKSDLNEVDKPAAVPFDASFSEFTTSRLEFEVKANATEFPIQVTKPGQRRD
jgi:hypothetical protein